MPDERVTIYRRRVDRGKRMTEKEREQAELEAMLVEHPPFTAVVRFLLDGSVCHCTMDVDPQRDGWDEIRERLQAECPSARLLAYAAK